MRITSLLVALTFSFALSAQEALKTGNRILGGGISFSQQNSEDSNPSL